MSERVWTQLLKVEDAYFAKKYNFIYTKQEEYCLKRMMELLRHYQNNGYLVEVNKKLQNKNEVLAKLIEKATDFGYMGLLVLYTGDELSEAQKEQNYGWLEYNLAHFAEVCYHRLFYNT